MKFDVNIHVKGLKRGTICYAQYTTPNFI